MNEIPLSEQETIKGIGEASGDLFHPFAIRLMNDSRDLHSSSLDVDNKEDVIANQTKWLQDLDGEKIRGNDFSQMDLNEGRPIHALTSFRRGLNAVVFQDVLHGRSTDRDSQIL